MNSRSKRKYLKIICLKLQNGYLDIYLKKKKKKNPHNCCSNEK